MKATRPVWSEDAFQSSEFKPLDTSLRVDVAIVGAGITGLTSALLLKRAGKRVAVIEARRLLGGVSGATTAHLTQVLDTRYHTLENRFGKETTQAVAASKAASISMIEKLVRELQIECGFERVPGYLIAQDAEQQRELDLEIEAAMHAGLPVAMTPAPLPFPTLASMRVLDQAQFNPHKYLKALAREINGGGSHVFIDTPVVAIHDTSPCLLETPKGFIINAENVIVATHSPLNRVLIQTKISHYQSYVISGPTKHALKGLFWDMDDPYHYIRTHHSDEGEQLIIGGADHKTGQEHDTEICFDKLIEYGARFELEPNRRWSAQVVESVDGLPFIGHNSNSKNIFVATGYSGNGMTFGTLAGMLLTDQILGKQNAWQPIYEATRIKPLASLTSYISENVDFPLQLVSTALKPAEVRSVRDVPRGEGKIVSANGKRVAVYRDLDGGLHAVSSVCTHLGCRVSFNTSESSWDCPCHGSRFGLDGSVLAGPALHPLEKQPIEDEPAGGRADGKGEKGEPAPGQEEQNAP